MSADASTGHAPSVHRRLRNAVRLTPLRHVVVARRHRGLEPTDMMVASYPRSGNTWLRFLLADLITGAAVDFVGVERVIPSVGAHAAGPHVARDRGRLIKTHEPYNSHYRRAIYLVRDVRDVLVSQYRVRRPDPEDLSALDDFVASFTTQRASSFGPWHEHVRGWLDAARSSSEIHVFKFEELRADPVGGVGEIARLAGIEADDAAVQAALDRNTPEYMHQLELENVEFLKRSFGYMSTGVRGGVTGKWREMLNDEHYFALAEPLALNRELGYADH